jgi:hypothetical protein
LACRGNSTSSECVLSIKIVEVSPDSPDAIQLIGELDVHLRAHPYPEQSRHAFSVEKLVLEKVTFFITYYRGELAGCGGIKIFPKDYGEVKRMWVRPVFRGTRARKGNAQTSLRLFSEQGIEFFTAGNRNLRNGSNRTLRTLWVSTTCAFRGVQGRSAKRIFRKVT